jgi:hypothetical protein
MRQPSAKSVLIVILLIGIITIPGIAFSIYKIVTDPGDTYSYITLTTSGFILLMTVGYVVQLLFGTGEYRVKPESDY